MTRHALHRWHTDRRINNKYTWLASHSSVSAALTSKSRHYHWESGFFRIGSESLSRSAVLSANRELSDLLASATSLPDQIVGALEQNRHWDKIRLQTQWSGHLIAYLALEPIIARDSHSKIRPLALNYVTNVLIPHDVWRHRRSWVEPFSLIEKRITSEMEILSCQRSRITKESGSEAEPPRDLVGIAIKYGAHPQEMAELIRRLILSTVGFLGCAIEWLLIDMSRFGHSSPAQAFCLESLRYHSPAWRLSREVATGHTIDSLTIPAGSTVLASLYAAHRDPVRFPDPATFDPGRWTDPSRYLLAFGRGTRVCPAKDFSIYLLATLYELCTDSHIKYQRKPFSKTRVATLNSPPRGSIIVY